MHNVEQTVARAPDVRAREPVKMTARIYGIMALTMVLTFATLETGHQLFFPPQQLFA